MTVSSTVPWALVIAVGIGFALLATGFVLGRKTGYSQPSYVEQRMEFVRRQVAQSDRVETLIIGDSLTEQTIFDNRCGPTFVAAVGGARLGDFEPHIGEFISRLRPKRVVVALGTNHFAAKNEMALFISSYRPFIEKLDVEETILVGLSINREANSHVRFVADQTGSMFIDPVQGPFVADGIHLTPEGSAIYSDTIEEACRGS